MRRFHVMALAAAVLAVAAGARAVGTITTAGATLTVGAGTPQGTLTNSPGLPADVAPSIPPVGTLGAIGTFSSTMPPFPGGGTGADGAFTAPPDLATAGGNFNFTTYTVAAGATVTYSSSAIVMTTGDVAIAGTVTTTGPNVAVTFLCGGNFTMSGTGKVQTVAAGGPILLDSNGTFTAADGGATVSAMGDCEIRAHGGDLTLPGATAKALAGNLTLRASGGILSADNLTFGAFTATGDLLVQAFGGDVSFTVAGNFPSEFITGTNSVAIEASLGVTITGSIDLMSDSGPVSITAFGGSVTWRSREYSSGATTVRASTSVFVDGGYLQAETAMTFTALSGDVDVKPSGGNCIMQSYELLTLEASRDVLLVGAGMFQSGNAGVLYRAIGGKVLIDQGAVLSGTFALAEIRAGNQVVLGSGTNRATSFRITAGAGGFSGGSGGLTADAGPIEITTLGPISVGGAYYAQDGDITVTSYNAGVTLPGGALNTGDASGPTRNVTVQSFADTAGVIDLTGGTIVTGNSTGGKSGDINLRVFAGKTGGGGTTTPVDSFLLPFKWTTKINARDAAKSKLIVAGVLDLGSSHPDLNAPATFEIGALQLAFAAPAANGKKLVATAPGAVLTLTPNARGGSRVPFTLTRTGDLTGAFPLDGEIVPCLRIGTFSASGKLVLAGGKFALTKAAGRLIAPRVFLRSVAATFKGGGNDTLSLSLGFATDGTAPVGADPGFKIHFGDTFTAEVPAASFGPKKGEKYTFKGSAPGITNVTVDYAKGVVTVKGKGLDLGAFADGANVVTIQAEFGGTTRTLVVRPVRTGTKLGS